MTSRSSSPSEGEIVESDSEKATKSLPSANGTSVDRTSRKRASPSRSPSPFDSPRRRRDRSGSRSPYRESRGSKRQRPDDHYSSRHDSRNFRGTYEDHRHEDRPSGRASYRDLDRGAPSGSSLRYDDRSTPSRMREKRPRTMSRSPPRFSSRRPSDSRDRSRRDSWSNAGRNRLEVRDRESGGRFSREQSVSERGTTPGTAAFSEAEAEQKQSQTNKSVSFKLGSKTEADNDARSGGTNPPNSDSHTKSGPLDEAALIEQRRQRREAIKAKHRGQGTPLLVQALDSSKASAAQEPQPETPGLATQAIDSLKISPPQTPNELPERSVPDSPTGFEFGEDSSLANGVARLDSDPQEDGPSAADYDPTIDMQEDKLRYESRHLGEDVSSGAYDETRINNQDILLPDAVAEKSATKKPKDEFDMFAEEYEEDMFAEAPPITKNTEAGDSARAVPVPTSKAIDMSMLDDWDDEEGYYKIILGELLDGRYHVQLNLGKGMFSAVVRAMDSVTKKLVAIKIIRSNETMKKAALKEIGILGTLNAADPENKKHVIRLERYFEHKGHLCMVFENLSINLREVLKKFGRDVGINLKAVRAYAQQMFLGLSLLRKCNILHADLKPDNVLVNESRNMLKICDLGSASDASENEITPYLVSRFYRAPEIILGMPYDFAIDTWSIGCTLFELYTGKILFTGRTNNQMLKSIMECRGKFSHKMLRKAQFAGLHFDNLLNFRSMERDKLSGKEVLRVVNITKPTRDLRARLMANNTKGGMAEAEAKELSLFIDLLDRCLNVNPEKRCTPAEALKHPFILKAKG